MAANMNEDYLARLYENLSARETTDLLDIYQHGTLDDWDEAVFEVIRRILDERAGSIPEPSTHVQVAFLNHEAHLLLDAEDWPGLLEKSNRMVDLLPEYYEGYTLRGRALDELDQLDQALLNLQTSLHLNPEQNEVWNEWLGVMDDMATRDAESTEACDFDNSAACEHLDLALDLIQEDREEVALAEIESALACLPDIALAHNYLGLIYEEMGRVDDAIEAYRQAIHCNPRFYAARENLANARIRWEGEQYRQAAVMEPIEEEQPEFSEEDWAAAPQSEEHDLLPGWFYLDETAFWLRGWPGNRTRPGRSGYDPLDKEFELAHMQGVILKRLFTGRFRTLEPFHFTVLLVLGLMFCSPFILMAGDPTNWVTMIIISVLSFYPIVGISILINLFQSFMLDPTEEDEENGRLFY